MTTPFDSAIFTFRAPSQSSIGVVEPFDGPNALVSRAEQQIDRLCNWEEEFANLSIPTLDLISSSETHALYRLSMNSQPIPMDVTLLLREIVSNLRVSLDVLICDAARILSMDEEFIQKKLKFPFEQSEKTLKEQFANMKLPDKLRAAITHVHPIFCDQTMALRYLHELDLIMKHRTVVPVRRVFFSSNPVAEMNGLNHLSRQTIGYAFSDLALLWTDGTEIEIRKDLGAPDVEMLDIPVLALPQTVPLGGSPILSSLSDITQGIKTIIRFFSDAINPNDSKSDENPIP